MSDDLLNGDSSTQDDSQNAAADLTGEAEKSPLESAMEKMPEGTPPSADSSSSEVPVQSPIDSISNTSSDTKPDLSPDLTNQSAPSLPTDLDSSTSANPIENSTDSPSEPISTSSQTASQAPTAEVEATDTPPSSDSISAGEDVPIAPAPKPEFQATNESSPLPSPEPGQAPQVEPTPPEMPVPSEPAENVDQPSTEPAGMPTDISSQEVSPAAAITPALEEEETAKAPDTDEFLKSILEEHPQPEQPASPAQQPSAASAVEPDAPEPSQDSILPPSQGNVGFSSSENTAAPVESEMNQASEASDMGVPPSPTNTASSFGDAGGSLDGIGNPPEQLSSPAAQPDEIDMNQPSKKSGGSGKLIGLVVIAAVLVAGGYFAYSKLFSPNSGSQQSASVTETPSQVAQLTNDETRKADLQTIQGKLLDYFAGTGGYPISATVIYLNTPDNVVFKALVPSFIAQLPADPDVTKNYGYKSDGKTFTLTAVLDDPTDKTAVIENGLTLFKVSESTQFSSASTVGTSSLTGATLPSPVSSSLSSNAVSADSSL